MKKQSVILIYDVGKTNKKVLLYDKQYRLVFEDSVRLNEITDEDGFPCENIHALTEWIKNSFQQLAEDERFSIEAVNFSAYGASFVCVDENLLPVLPLYNYLKPYPEELKKRFYAQYGGEAEFSKKTSSPILGNLNSGMQLYRLKYEKPKEFSRIKYALHLPQYISSILTKNVYSEITGIGCHTNLWHFEKHSYHEWVFKEGIAEKFPPILNSNRALNHEYKGRTICAGIGLHDSSSALIPYLTTFHEPFLLLSTGTWCISLNAFNKTVLSSHELENDCLCYLTYKGLPVKASRLFAGFEHEQKVKQIAQQYKVQVEQVIMTEYNAADIVAIKSCSEKIDSYEKAYHCLMIDLVKKQTAATQLVSGEKPPHKIFVDGGFSTNSIYMNLIAAAFPNLEVYAAVVPQSSALGAALAIHENWNSCPMPTDSIQLKRYPPPSKE